ncbi:MAG: D-alanyl-D-alanine carboxypeptidase family protein [Candidatus Berkiellales bacterium]
MFRAVFIWVSALTLLILSQFVLAITPTVPTPPEVTATAYVLVDFHSNKVLAERESNKRVDPASLTKMMTVYVIDHELKSGRFTLQNEVPISENAWRTEGSRMFIPVGKKITVSELLHGVIIQSGNDATVALAEFAAGSESAFAELMNQYATQLGMKNTHFVNSTGIPHPEHYTTAYDLSLLARAMIAEFPETYKIYSEKWFTFNGIKQPNRNRLLWREPYIDGIKTGHSSTAGYCLTASGQKDNMRLISVVVGAPTENDRTEQTLQLLRYGFRFFETHHLFQANTKLNETRVWMGAQRTVPLGVDHDLFITIPQGHYKNLDAKMNIEKRITAPIAKGKNYGQIVVKLGDEKITEVPLVALENVHTGTLWARISDYFSLGLHKVFNSHEAEPTEVQQQT